jgi:hypothetical protein
MAERTALMGFTLTLALRNGIMFLNQPLAFRIQFDGFQLTSG